MSAAARNDALLLLDQFLRTDEHYLASSAAYGDAGLPALNAALDLFLARPDLGFVWIGYLNDEAAAICVVTFSISTSIGALVAKLDDVFVAPGQQHRGIATAMLTALGEYLRTINVKRIDTSVHTGNWPADAFYRKLGFKELGEERLSLIL
jgi:GNAT superfamily N-acetyltransferase